MIVDTRTKFMAALRIQTWILHPQLARFSFLRIGNAGIRQSGLDFAMLFADDSQVASPGANRQSLRRSTLPMSWFKRISSSSQCVIQSALRPEKYLVRPWSTRQLRALRRT